MESPCTITRPPEGLALFVFGSALRSRCPGDLDLLVLYDETIIRPRDAYSTIGPVVCELEASLGLPVHLAVLSHREERQTNFISEMACVPIRIWFERRNGRDQPGY